MRTKPQILASLFFVCFTAQSLASDLQDAANCAATFRVLNNIGHADEALGNYFNAQTMIAFDMIGVYGREERGSISNGETGQLVNEAQRRIDSERAEGEAFKPLVASCMGWTYRLIPYINDATGGSMSPSYSILISAPRPTTNYDYPFEDWQPMEEIFEAAYSIWTDMGKLTPEDIKNEILRELDSQ